jgi:AAA domain
VIKLETAHIEEVRGIRKLDIDFRMEKFAISGPNGSGKSGVIDAIEFGLTGQIGRLTGRGTKGLSVAEHGPHVDKAKFPDAAFVELQVYLTDLGKSVTINRRISAPKKPKITPFDNDVKTVLAEIADHPEIALSRREILRFILVEPTKRAEEIQAILKLDEIGHVRSALYTAQNRLQSAQKTAATQMQSNRDALLLHLQIATLRTADVLEAANKRRVILGLPEIADLTADTKLDAGLAAGATVPQFNKVSALRDLKALSDATVAFPTLAMAEAAAIVADLSRLEADPGLLAALQRRSFIEKGLELVDGPECPLCDTPWDSDQHLRDHLKVKLARSEEARKVSARSPQEWYRNSAGGHLGCEPCSSGPEACGGRYQGRAAAGGMENQPRRPAVEVGECRRLDRPEGSSIGRVGCYPEDVPGRLEKPHRKD